MKTLQQERMEEALADELVEEMIMDKCERQEIKALEIIKELIETTDPLQMTGCSYKCGDTFHVEKKLKEGYTITIEIPREEIDSIR